MASRMRMSPPRVIPTMAPAGKWRVLLVAESAALLGVLEGVITETLGVLKVGCANVSVDVGRLGVKEELVVCCWVVCWVVVTGGGLKLVDELEEMMVVKVNGPVRVKP